MLKMRDLSGWIRNYGQDARHQKRLFANRFIWLQIWNAVAIIDDVDSALNAYLDNEFPTDTGERYLRLYGVMQGLFLQQDALFNLIKGIHPTKEITLTDVLKNIREARTASVAHPTAVKHKRGKLSTHVIVRQTMTKEGFELFSYPSQEE